MVGAGYAREPVGDHQHGFAFRQGGKGFVDQAFETKNSVSLLPT
jgi:hypothetical protein